MASHNDKNTSKRCKVAAKDSKFNGGVLTKMREVVYGSDTRKEVRDTLQYADRLRNNDELMRAAEEKRLRKRMRQIKIK